MTFSVIIPIYKAEKYLVDCIQSVLRQSFKDFELLLIIDGSPDNSIGICNDYASRDKRISVFDRENCGVALTRNFGIEQARGQYIAFLDADDYWHSDYLRTVFEAFHANPCCGVCATAYWRIRDDGSQILIQDTLNTQETHIIQNYPHQWIYSNCIITSAMCVNKQLLKVCGGFKPGVKIAEDLDLWIRLNNTTWFIYINAPLMYYRVATEHSSSKVCDITDFFPFEQWYDYHHNCKESLSLMTSILLYRNYKLALKAGDKLLASKYLSRVRYKLPLFGYLIKNRIINKYLKRK